MVIKRAPVGNLKVEARPMRTSGFSRSGRRGRTPSSGTHGTSLAQRFCRRPNISGSSVRAAGDGRYFWSWCLCRQSVRRCSLHIPCCRPDHRAAAGLDHLRLSGAIFGLPVCIIAVFRKEYSLERNSRAGQRYSPPVQCGYGWWHQAADQVRDLRHAGERYALAGRAHRSASGSTLDHDAPFNVNPTTVPQSKRRNS
jgi:hypothetical protein